MKLNKYDLEISFLDPLSTSYYNLEGLNSYNQLTVAPKEGSKQD